MENKIGVVANLCMKGIALENECISVPEAEAGKFIRDLSCAATEMLKAENQTFLPIKYPENLRSQIIELSQLCPQSHLGKDQHPIILKFDIQKILEKIGKFYHDVVGTLGGQLQIEVDRGKSANRSNPEVVNALYLSSSLVITSPLNAWSVEYKVLSLYRIKRIC